MLWSFKIPKDKSGVTSASLLFCGTKAQRIGKYCTCLRLIEWEYRVSWEVTYLQLVRNTLSFVQCQFMLSNMTIAGSESDL
jgi:hypothetical protein